MECESWTCVCGWEWLVVLPMSLCVGAALFLFVFSIIDAFNDNTPM